MISLNTLGRRISIRSKLAYPVFLICVVCVLLGTRVIENNLNKRIYTQQEEEMVLFSNHLLYTLKADFETLFFNFGKNAHYFQSANTAAQEESINRLRNLLQSSAYQAYIVLPHEQEIYLTSFEKPLPLASRLRPKTFQKVNGYFAYKDYFYPWDWELVLLKESSVVQQIIANNSLLVSATISVLMVVIIIFLLLIMRIVIQKPFARLFAHLEQLGTNLNTPALELSTSKETFALSQHINAMSQTLREKNVTLLHQKQRYHDILNAQPSLVFVTSGTDIRYANATFFDFFDTYATLEEFKKEHRCVCDFFEPVMQNDFVHKTENGEWLTLVQHSAIPKKAMIIKNGHEHIFTLLANSLRGAQEECVVTMTDITPLEHYKRLLEKGKEELSRQLHTDKLTQLPNRLSLTTALSIARTASLALFNINDFKEINDFYGVKTGDKLLREYGERLGKLGKEKNVGVFKLSADEYALFFPHFLDEASIIETTMFFLETMNQELFFDLSTIRRISVSTSAGLTVNTSGEKALVEADIALKTAKKKQKPLLTFDESQETQARFATNIEWANRLKEAFAQDKIVPYFQPIFNNATGEIEKYEALVRMLDADNEPIAPCFFLDVAKKSHQYFQLTETMIEKTFAFMQDKPYDFSINLSESDLMDYSINSLIVEKLKKHGHGNRVVFEIVETERIDDYELVARFVQEVKHYGAKIAIDDFGSGFSNFQHVAKLNVDYIKIDGSLIQNILFDANSLAIVESIHAFASRLGIKTIAEYVETLAVYEKIKAIGIHYTQGYFIAQPSPDLYSSS